MVVPRDEAGGTDHGQAHRSDPGLVRACLDGDALAWEELVERYQRLVYSIPRRMGFSAEDADDVFQNVFVALYRGMGELRDQTRLSSWLITATRRECWRLGKDGARSTVLTQERAEAIADELAAPAEEIAQLERDQLVREAVRRLDVRCRELLTALFLAPTPPSYDALARQLAMPVGSIGPTRARCFRKLEAILLSVGVVADG